MENQFFRRLGVVGVSLLMLYPSCTWAQNAPSPFTRGHRYDLLGHETGVISPSSSGSAGPFMAVRKTYNPAGEVTLSEEGYLSSWQSEATAPANWSGFTVFRSTTTIYDEMERVAIVAINGPDGSAQSLTHYNYDISGHPLCTAVRMNSAVYPTLPLACNLSSQGSGGPDRITKNIYDAVGQLVQVRKAVGTSLETADATYAYSANGKQTDVIDADGNHAKMVYDGFDRQIAWIFPSDIPASQRSVSFDGSSQATALATAGAAAACNIGQISATQRVWPDGTSTDYSGPVDAKSSGDDCEKYSYDANGARVRLVKRDGAIISYEHDGMSRQVYKEISTIRTGLPPTDPSYLPATDVRSVYYSYDYQNHQTAARFDSLTGEGVTNAFDGLGRQTSSTLTMDSASRTVSYLYDLDGNRTRTTFPDQNFVTYNYDGLDRPLTIQRSVAASSSATYCPGTLPAGTIASYCYRSDGERQSFNGGVTTNYDYDGIGRLTSLSNTPNGNASYANTYGFTFNAASQITSLSKSNNLFMFGGTYNVNRAYTVNGLNQYTGAGSASFVYDANGNLTGDGSTTFLYDVENRLVGAGGNRNAQLRYDPLGRLYEIAGPTGTTHLFYDGDALIGEYDASGNLLRRYVHGADLKSDDPIAWYEGASFDGASERFLRPDWQGSIGLVTDNTGAAIYGVNTFDEYGIPGANNLGRFQYTGQVWVSELGMYYYKARFYSPTIGRFMQTDPIGYKDQINLYAYVHNDPVDGTDPTGEDSATIVVPAPKLPELKIEWGALGARMATYAIPFARGLSIGGVVVYALTPINYGQTPCDTVACVMNNNTPPEDAKDPNGAKAPGKAGEAEGFQDPKSGEKWGKVGGGPLRGKGGFIDKDGKIWVPTGQGGRAHGGGGGLRGAHWDVQNPDGSGHRNVYPGGKTR